MTAATLIQNHKIYLKNCNISMLNKPRTKVPQNKNKKNKNKNKNKKNKFLIQYFG